ncbi:BTAD domain-containing putative transcriptional regulator [Lentzea sp. JNUCC 0626]|uniref:AfsR/SARP family transcriptional regulator n=1 Tax=Lentzea sp. JNUCC 0626 TaxID=3367513 RepID=UPI003748BAE4
MTVEIALLGEVSARVGGRTADLGPARQRTVLAALAIDVGRVVAVDRLTARVWGTDPPARSRATLHSYLSRLRHALGVTLTATPAGYVLEAEESSVDLMRFRKLHEEAKNLAGEPRARLLTEALGLWRGEPLTGVAGDWADVTREQLVRDRTEAELDLVDARLGLGQGPELLAAISTRAARFPLDERVAAQHLCALAQAGRLPEALEEFHAVRARLKAELGTEPGPALREQHEKLLASHPEPRRAVPRQLPSAPAKFVGRDQDLTDLDDALKNTTVATIAGAGGMGKTWLALQWAHRNLHRFPDGQLFVDLRGFSPDESPMDPDVAIRGFLPALGVDANRVPPTESARAALFRDVTKKRRMLLVIDNAADAAQVAPLLPGGTTCRVLVTSRHRLPSPSALGLDVLTDHEATALLAGLIGTTRLDAEPLAATRLIDLCGGLPLALSIAGARVLTEPGLALADLARQLDELRLAALDADPRVSVPVVLSGSYRALPERQKTVFALLGGAPGEDIDLHAAAGLAGLSTEDVREALTALAQASLVSIGAGFRVRMHDLVRTYAAEQPIDGRAEALRRLVDHHVHTAHAHDRLIDPYRPLIALGEPTGPVVVAGDKAGALAWFDAERETRRAVQRAAALHGHNDEVVLLARVSHAYHQQRGRLDDELAMWQTALDVAQDPADRAVAHRIMGSSLGQVGRFDEALHHLSESVAVAEQVGEALPIADAHGTLAWLWASRDEHARAFEHAKAALPHYEKSGNQMLIAMAHNNIAHCAVEVGDTEQGRTSSARALGLLHELKDRQGEASALDTLARIEHECGDHETAITHYEHALELFQEEGDNYSAANTLINLGEPHLALGQHQQAVEVWRRALAMLEQQDREDDAARVRDRLGSAGPG